MKKVFLIFQLLLVVMLAQAQMMNPVKFTSSLKTDGSAVAEIVFSGKIQPGWRLLYRFGWRQTYFSFFQRKQA